MLSLMLAFASSAAFVALAVLAGFALRGLIVLEWRGRESPCLCAPICLIIGRPLLLSHRHWCWDGRVGRLRRELPRGCP